MGNIFESDVNSRIQEQPIRPVTTAGFLGDPEPEGDDRTAEGILDEAGLEDEDKLEVLYRLVDSYSLWDHLEGVIEEMYDSDPDADETPEEEGDDD